MKSAIYYYSKTGHSKDYASSLASRIVCPTYSYKQLKYRNLKSLDTIIFISCVHGNKIKHVDKFLKLYKKIKDKNLIIVAVGMQPSSSDRRQSLITVNLLDQYHIRLYELVGGFDANKLPWILRKIMEIGLKAEIKKDPQLLAQGAMLDNVFKIPREYNDVVGIERIMDVIHRLERENKKV